ncbi:MAG TPA: HYR domain-containing protein [Sandaracinaceae bacterium LLY-WYZ-13_1]|nr:HYR domain-containing protein [Sandaracinaceae bacterium LLY-WYZ-13_1]
MTRSARDEPAPPRARREARGGGAVTREPAATPRDGFECAPERGGVAAATGANATSPAACAWWVVLALAAPAALACGEPAPTLDAGCAEPGTAPDQPVVACPAEVDLGCIDPAGAPLDVSASVSSCDGTAPAVACTPGTVTAGVSEGTCTATAPSGATARCTFPIRYRVEGPSTLLCPDDVSVVCTGPRTDVALDPPSVMASCDAGAVADPTNDGPADGFAVGTTPVTWEGTVGGETLSCDVSVTVRDETAPTVECAPTTVVRTAPDAPASFEPPPVSDDCAGSLAVEVTPMPTERGTHAVTATATDDGGNTGRCDFELTVLDVFAPTGLRVVSAARAGGATDVTLGWTPSAGADVTDVRLERAPAETGPWTALDTLAPGVTTYTDAAMPGPLAFYRLVALSDGVEGGVTAPVRAFAVEAERYHLEDRSVPSVPFATSLYGVVRYPADAAGVGPHPLVVFLHGNHGNCRPASGDDECATLQGHACTEPGYTTTPNAEGYLYLQETLAAQGFVTVSLSANALNCREDYIPERTQLILEHLRRWTTWAGSGGTPFGRTFAGRVDLSRTALVGHSRGGEAVASAPAALAATPVAGVSLASVFAIGPTDYHEPRPSGVPFAVLLPGCDADVRTLEGLRQYDRGLDPSDPNARAQVLYVGANHNFFNAEWRFDDNEQIVRVCDGADLVGGAAQRGMLEVVLSDWVRATTAPARLPAYVRAEADTPALVDAWADRDLDLRWSYAAAERLAVDDFTDAAAPDVNRLGEPNVFEGMIASVTCTGRCARNWSHLTGAARPAWQTAPGRVAWTTVDVDASAYDVLSMRFASRIATINDGLSEHDFRVRLVDTAGTAADVLLSSAGRLPHRYPSRAEQEVLNTVRVPLGSFLVDAPGLDLEHLAAVELLFGTPGNDEGSIWVADVDLAAD